MRRFLPLVLILLLASCAPGPTAAPTPSVPEPSAAASPVLSLPSPAPTAAVTSSPGPQPLGPRLGYAQADFDCDGLPDSLEFFTAPRAGTYVSVEAGKLARLTRNGGGVVELAFDGMPFDGAATSPLIGVADVNGDGCDDAIVNVGHGASTVWTTFFVFDGTELRRVEEDGSPVTFLFGGSVRHGNSIECRTRKDATEIVVRGVSDYTSDLAWDAVEDVHHWSSRWQLVLWSSSRSVIPVSTAYAMPADQDRYWGLSCGNVKLPG